MINSILIKPTGPDCNLRCNYCFYRRKSGMFDGKTHRMNDEVLEMLIKSAMQMGVSTFSWQGGEPTLMGLDFFRKVVDMEIKHGLPGMPVANALQTNGVLLDQQWAQFLAEYRFLVGISVDGPKKLHDHYRKDSEGKGTHARIMRNIEILCSRGVDFNVLVLLNNINVQEPDAVYDFLKEHEIYFMQFIPCVEAGQKKGEPEYFCVTPDAYGDFMVRVFDKWVQDFPDVSIRDFDDLLLHELGRPINTCMFSERCGSYVVVEHNGDAFCCDYFVTSQYRLGNIMETPLSELVESERFKRFTEQKTELGDKCKACPYLTQCYGGCQKDRVVLGGKLTDTSYLCKAYRKLFSHAKPVLPELVERLRKMGRI